MAGYKTVFSPLKELYFGYMFLRGLVSLIITTLVNKSNCRPDLSYSQRFGRASQWYKSCRSWTERCARHGAVPGPQKTCLQDSGGIQDSKILPQISSSNYLIHFSSVYSWLHPHHAHYTHT